MSLGVYLHTHWDREWYSPFETMRCDLIKVASDVADRLEKGLIPSFYLDGQSCVLEDIASLKPDLRERLAALMKRGLLSAGPWYVLNDQMLVSGESLVRNLRAGLRAARQFGPPSMVGYCPDTFGHSQDLPRILSGFGIRHAVVWRGVPQMEGGPFFLWKSPCGASVWSYHLEQGYYQTAFHEDIDTEELFGRLAPWLAKNTEGAVPSALYPVGADHVGPPFDFAARLESLNGYLDGAGGPRLEVVDMAGCLQALEADTVSGGRRAGTHTGELRDNRSCDRFARAYLLPGVLSSRLYLKRANRQAEHALYEVLEPVLALLSLAGLMDYPQAELAHAGRLLLLNHPHDSICGCSVDAVHEDMMGRFRAVNDVLEALTVRAADALARAYGGPSPLNYRDPDFGADSLVFVNTSASPQSGPVRVSFTEEAGRRKSYAKKGLQVIKRRASDELFSGLGQVPYYKDVNLVEAYVWADNVPPLALAQVPWPLPPAEPEGVKVEGQRLTNGRISVEVDADGAVAARLENKTYRLGHWLRDLGDGGDTYNFDPLAGDQPVNARLVSVKPGLRGPLVGSLVLTYALDLPQKAIEGKADSSGVPVFTRSAARLKHVLRTEMSIAAGSDIVSFETKFVNRASDHRLEVVFDTGLPVTSTLSENHFSLVERLHEGRQSPLPVDVACEALPDRFPCQRFFLAGGQVFLNKGLPEYGVFGSCVTITLLRAVSVLSRGRLRTRGGGAGPHVETPGANCLGWVETSYAWAPPPGREPVDQTGYERACEISESYNGRVWAAFTRGPLAQAGRSLFASATPAVRLVALFQNEHGSTIMRLLNVDSAQQAVSLSLPASCRVLRQCGLDERTLKELPAASDANGMKQATVVLEGSELVTLSLSRE